ncbi:quinate transport [Fusarium agapanthi]|uniref:Quinate transport n=1 Tax=Fusarium agapanthi TaxID=1803897 RepID=A0A9P5B489_9HYPO|nr:quinate transport [Fusarium agapanthi]
MHASDRVNPRPIRDIPGRGVSRRVMCAERTVRSIASASVAAVRWFGILANDASNEAFPDTDAPLGLDGELLDTSPDGQADSDITPLQKATRIIDTQPPTRDTVSNHAENSSEKSLWQASESISLHDREQTLFQNFLHRTCSWLDLFGPARTFSTRVPHLAVRNAGLLNAILALSCYHQSLDETIPPNQQIQKAMRYSAYQNSQELMATTLMVSTYEMLRGPRKDWQQHLQGVFWILRSRQIEVDTSSLESTTWWAWLRQDVWVAFREKRRTYSTWMPKKGYADLDSHELASRAVWIMAQVINFCAVDSSAEVEGMTGRIGWAKALRKMLDEWRSHLTVEFSALPTMGNRDSEVFQPHLIHPQCFGLAVQLHHCSRILITAHEPHLDGIQGLLKRQKEIQESIKMVCGIGMTLTEDVSSMLSSQCLFIGPPPETPRRHVLPQDMILTPHYACFAGALFGVDAGIIGGVLAMPDFNREFGLDTRPKEDAADLSGNLVTTMQAGAIAGALLSSPFADRKGRKPALLLVAVTGFIGGIMQAFSYDHLSIFYIGRFVEGLGLGAGTMLAPTYVSENSPRAIRGFLVGFFQLLLVLGGMTACFINCGSLLHLPGKATWMVPLGMLFCPESPRWLALRDQWEKAGAVLPDVRKLPVGHAYIQQELLELKMQIDQEREIMQDTGFWALQKECWTLPWNRKRALLTVAIVTLGQWTGTGAINYYAPTIFSGLGLSSTTTALFAQGIYGVVKVVTCLIFIFFLADSLGRRKSFMFGGAIQAFCMFFVGFHGSVSLKFQRIDFVHTMLLSLRSLTGAYFIFGSFNLFMAIAAYWIPETKGISLERMDGVFGVADFSNVEDVGIAARRSKRIDDEDVEDIPAPNKS